MALQLIEPRFIQRLLAVAEARELRFETINLRPLNGNAVFAVPASRCPLGFNIVVQLVELTLLNIAMLA